MTPEDPMHGTEVDRYWDAWVLTGHPLETDTLDADTQDMIDHLWLIGVPPQAAEARGRVWRQLRQESEQEEYAMDTTSSAAMRSLASGNSGQPNARISSLPTRNRIRPRWKENSGWVATVVLVVLMITASLYVSGPLRPSRVATQPAGDSAMFVAPATPSGTPTTEAGFSTETVIDVAEMALPASHAQLYAMVTELQPGVSATLDGQVGTMSYRVEQGTVRITHAGDEHIVREGERWSAPVDGIAAFENVGDEVARIVEVDVLDATATSSLDANYASKFSDPQGGKESFIISGSTTFAGGRGRVMLERLTFRPGAVADPYSQPDFGWVGIAAGRVSVTLEGERLPFRWDAGEARSFGLSQSLPTITPGTEVTLRNADDVPLILYRLTIKPSGTEEPPFASPTP